MNRQIILVIALSLISALGGAVLYTSLYSKPQIVSAERNPAMQTDNTRPVSFNDLVLNDLDGLAHRLSEWQKPILLVNFWAPWCAPCRREIPDLIELQKIHADDLQIIGLSFDSRKNVAEFQQQHEIPYPLLLVNSEATLVNHFFGNNSGALPFSVILNQQREIIYQHHGEISKAELENQISTLLATQ